MEEKNKKHKTDEKDYYHNCAMAFIEESKSVSVKRSKDYFQGWKDGVMDFAHLMDGNFN